MLSPSVKVREFEVQDVTPYAIEVAWGPIPAAGQPFEAESSSVLFAAGTGRGTQANAFSCLAFCLLPFAFAFCLLLCWADAHFCYSLLVTRYSLNTLRHRHRLTLTGH